MESAIGRLKSGKAGLVVTLCPLEMVKAYSCNDEIVDVLLDIVHDVCNLGHVPKDWCNAVLIPLPK